MCDRGQTPRGGRAAPTGCVAKQTQLSDSRTAIKGKNRFKPRHSVNRARQGGSS